MRILAVAAHPDDEILGCGGTLARYAAQGHQVDVLIVGEGISSRYGITPPPDMAEEIKALHSAGRRAHQLLGIRESRFLSLPDNRLDSLPLLEVIKPIEKQIHTLDPHLVFTHHNGDLNIDHQVVHRAVMTAARPLEGSSIKALYAFETLSSTEWAFDQFPHFTPNVFVDIEPFLDQKIQAMEAYSHEMRPFPHPRSEQAIRHQAGLRGAAVNQKASEAFVLIREIHA